MTIQEALAGCPSWIRQTFRLRSHPRHGSEARRACKAWIATLRQARELAPKPVLVGTGAKPDCVRAWQESERRKAKP